MLPPHPASLRGVSHPERAYSEQIGLLADGGDVCRAEGSPVADRETDSRRAASDRGTPVLVEKRAEVGRGRHGCKLFCEGVDFA